LSELSKLESDLLRIHWIVERMTILYKEIPNLKFEEKYTFGSIIREFAIVQIANFLKARCLILTSFADVNKKDLDPALRHIIEPILYYEDALKKIRDGYVAHIQDDPQKFEPFELSIHHIISDSKFPSSAGDIRMMIGRVRLYCEFVLQSFSDEYKTALDKYNKAKPKYEFVEELSVSECDELIKKEMMIAIDNLKSKGLKYPKIKK